MKYPLEYIDPIEFESVVISICQNILGIGAIGFTEGKDGGRDCIFDGKAQNFPSTAYPWQGHFIIQAKHSKFPASCSDSEFSRIIDKEIPKLKKLKKNNKIDYYLIFTNRRLTAQANDNIKDKIKKETGIQDAFVIADDTIQGYLADNSELVKKHNLQFLFTPIELYDSDICDIIKAFPSSQEIVGELEKNKFLNIPKEEKNKINELSTDYFDTVLKRDISYFSKIQSFLEDPANTKYKEKYENTIHDLRVKISTHKEIFTQFEKVFEYFSEYILNKNKDSDIIKKRRFICIFLHYMYFTCDIGKKTNDENI